MPYPPRYLRLTNFLQLLQSGGAWDQNAAGFLDAELNNLVASIDQVVSRFQAITSASGQLINNVSALAMALAGTARFTASANQTVFTTTIPWDSSFASTTTQVFRLPAGTTQGFVFDSSGYTVTNASGVLRVTLTGGQTINVNDIIIIDAFSPGAGVLAQLASLTSGQGASLVGIADLGGFFAATTVEGALAEFKTAYNAFVTSVGSTANIIRSDGSVAMAAALAMGAHKITGLADGTANTDAVTVQQLNAATQGLLTLTSYFLRADVAIPWQVGQEANSHVLSNLTMTSSLGATASEAANQSFVTNYVAAQLLPITTTLSTITTSGVTGQRIVTYTTPTSGTGYTWTTPVGVSAAVVELWGGGGSGATGVSYDATGAGGGGYAEAFLTLVTGDVLTLVVGAGGTITAQTGGDSVLYVNGAEVARAKGGAAGTNDNTALNGGDATLTPNVKLSGGVTIRGGCGGSPYSNESSSTYVHFGGSGGASPRGGLGGAGMPTSTVRSDGRAPGGGGGGRNVTSDGGNGGNGAAHIRY